MKPAFWVCFLLVFASGLSAYIGNEWGRKLGKRKLSLFRMRPRHTSTFLTIVLSMCLSLGMMGVLFVFSPQLQQQLFLPHENPESVVIAYQQALVNANTQLQRLRVPETGSLSNAVTQTPPTPLSSAGNLSSFDGERWAQASVATAVPERVAAPSRQLASPPVSQPESRRFQQGVKVAPVQVKSPESEPSVSGRESTQQPAKESAKEITQEAIQQPIQEPTSGRQLTRLARTLPSRLQARRPANVTIDAPGAESSQREVSPTSPPLNYPQGALFQLTLNGNLEPSDSQRVGHGVQSLTRNYLAFLGVEAQHLNWSGGQLQAEIRKLIQPGTYRVQVALSEHQGSKIPARIQVTRIAEALEEDFDPQLLLEEERLQNPRSQQALQQDLQAVLQKHATQHQIALNLQVPPVRPVVRSARLPFDIVNFKSRNGVLTGELFLRSP